MENNVLVDEGGSEEDVAEVQTHAIASLDAESGSKESHGMHKTHYTSPSRRSPGTTMAGEDTSEEDSLPQTAVAQVRQLIDGYKLTREQLVMIYDDYAVLKSSSCLCSPEAVSREETAVLRDVELGASEKEHCIRLDSAESAEMECESGEGVYDERSPSNSLESRSHDDANTSSADEVNLSEIGQKRKHFTLEEELKVQLSPFVEQLLERDQTIVAHAIKRYMNQYSIPQREVVELTGLNQSHLSQHFLHGVTMKRAKRVKLYHWFEDDQKNRTGKLQSADGSLSAVLESPRVEGNRRRPRWKWSPISTQILTEAFKKNQFPTRDQRIDLARICNEAEVAMNNGALARGPEGDTEGITEQRVNTWFTNRRKGLGTPITPPPSKVSTPGSGTPLFASMLHPTLLRAGPATTPVLAKHSPSPFKTPSLSLGSPQRIPLAGISPTIDDKAGTPTTVQTLVTQIQESQVNQQQTGTSSPIPQLVARPQMALPLAIAIPGGSHPSLLGSPAGSIQSSSTPHPTTLHTVTMPFSISPTLISPSQVQALISQFHSPFVSSTTPLSTTINRRSPIQSHDITGQSHDRGIGTPLTVQSVTIASEPPPMIHSSRQAAGSPQLDHESDDKGMSSHPPQFQLPGNVILSPNQLQALMSQFQAQQKEGQLGGFQLVTVPTLAATNSSSESDS